MADTHAGQIPRRTVAKGAVWTVPVIAMAQAAPSMAASLCLPPSIPPLNAQNWQKADLSPGQHNTQPGTGFTDDGMYWSRDDVRRGQTSPSIETLTTTIDVVVGCTYEFSFVGIKIQNNGPNQPDHTEQTVQLKVNGSTIISATSGPSTDTLPGLEPTIQHLSGRYSATTTGSVPISFVFTIMAPSGTNYGNDDIRVADLTASVV